MTLAVLKIMWAFVCSHWHHILGVVAFFLAAYERASKMIAKAPLPSMASTTPAPAPVPAPAPSALPAPLAEGKAKKNKSKSNKRKPSKH